MPLKIPETIITVRNLDHCIKLSFLIKK